MDFAGPELVAPFHTALTALGVDCRALDTYAYGSVRAAANGQLTIRAKDSNGQVITDDLDPSTSCQVTRLPS